MKLPVGNIKVALILDVKIVVDLFLCVSGVGQFPRNFPHESRF